MPKKCVEEFYVLFTAEVGGSKTIGPFDSEAEAVAEVNLYAVDPEFPVVLLKNVRFLKNVWE